MLLCSLCNRTKSWDCEHISMQSIGRVDLLFSEADVRFHDELKRRAELNGKIIQDYIIEKLKVD